MASPYSVDLRKKIVETYEQEKITQPALAKRFKVSLSSVKRYLRLDRTGITLNPRTEGKGRPGKIDESGYEIIKKIVEENPTITLENLSELFYKKKKIKAGRSILSRACQKLQLRYKKLSRYAQERDREEVKKNAKRTGKR